MSSENYDTARAALDRLPNAWRQSIDRFLVARIDQLRERNDNPKLNDVDTAALRGRIAECKTLRDNLIPRTEDWK